MSPAEIAEALECIPRSVLREMPIDAERAITQAAALIRSQGAEVERLEAELESATTRGRELVQEAEVRADEAERIAQSAEKLCDEYRKERELLRAEVAQLASSEHECRLYERNEALENENGALIDVLRTLRRAVRAHRLAKKGTYDEYAAGTELEDACSAADAALRALDDAGGGGT